MMEWISKTCLKGVEMKTRASKTQSLKVMCKDKFCKLENRIFLRVCRKLLCEFIMNARSTILRICLV
jgi:hypothetical protein